MSLAARLRTDYFTKGAGCATALSNIYAYGPARGPPDSKFGTFTATLDDEAEHYAEPKEGSGQSMGWAKRKRL